MSRKKRENRLVKIKEWIKTGICFDNVIYCDEKVFSLDGPNNYKTWCQKTESSTRIRRQAGGGGLMVFLDMS